MVLSDSKESVNSYFTNIYLFFIELHKDFRSPHSPCDYFTATQLNTHESTTAIADTNHEDPFMNGQLAFVCVER